MTNIIVAGCGTDVGKTVVSAVLTQALSYDYWKPIQCGDLEASDSMTIQRLAPTVQIHPPAYAFPDPISPHAAARRVEQPIDPERIVLPITERPLIIEPAGGILVPLTDHLLSIDLFSRWQAAWVVVSRIYLGSINHTLMTIESLKARSIDVRGIIFNEADNRDTEETILHFSKLPCLGRIYREPDLTAHTIEGYARIWKTALTRALS